MVIKVEHDWWATNPNAATETLRFRFTPEQLDALHNGAMLEVQIKKPDSHVVEGK